MLSPMTPHIAEELWEMLGHSGGIAQAKWPAYREDLTREEQIEIIIQINGRVRGKMLVEDGLSEEETLRARAERSAHLGVDRGQADRENDRRAEEAGQYRVEVVQDSGAREPDELQRERCRPDR